MKTQKRARCIDCTPRTLTTKFAPCRVHAADEERRLANEERRLANKEPVAPAPRH